MSRKDKKELINELIGLIGRVLFCQHNNSRQKHKCHIHIPQVLTA